jgi:hypothetical protein
LTFSQSPPIDLSTNAHLYSITISLFYLSNLTGKWKETYLILFITAMFALTISGLFPELMIFVTAVGTVRKLAFRTETIPWAPVSVLASNPPRLLSSMGSSRTMGRRFAASVAGSAKRELVYAFGGKKGERRDGEGGKTYL